MIFNPDDLRSAFTDIFRIGAKSIQSRPFQIEVAKHLLEGRSVILRAPTGAGKTFAAWFPFLYAFREQLPFPRQMLYSLPLRVLANSLATTAAHVAKNHSVRIQTGEIPEDPQFLYGDMVFSTYDQTLSSFLHFPFSLPRKQGNVNAGALVSSYLVFDEVHLMEMNRALGTAGVMLHWLRSSTPFLLMTATLTDIVVGWLREKTGAVLVELSPEAIDTLPRPRMWTYKQEKLTSESVVKEHKGKTIIVVNQVERAQQLFMELNSLKENGDITGTEIVLLHSRFTRNDRAEKTQQICKWYGEEPDGTDCILIATQVIEVGLDISCTQLHTEIAPANSLVQRAGRCARFYGEGKVFVYDVPKENRNPYLPYSNELCKATELALPILCEKSAGYAQELAFVKTVHSEPDRKTIQEFEREAREKQIEEAIRSLDPAYYRELIREVDAISAIISNRPTTTTNPFSYEAFSLPISVLMGKFRAVKEVAPDQIFAWFVSAKERSADDLYDRTTFEWHPVNAEEDMLRTPRIALNTAFASYDDSFGLRLNVKGNWRSPIVPQRPAVERTVYVRETYEEHIRKVWSAFERHFLVKNRLSYASWRLEKALGLPCGTIDLLLRMVIAFHDTAKMTEKWQDVVNKYQLAVGCEPAKRGEFLAHTDYNPSNDFHRSKESSCQRPPHALESAVATGRCVASYFNSIKSSLGEKVVKAFLAAVATHHSPTATTIRREQTLKQGAAQEAVRIAREVVGITLPEEATDTINNKIPEFTNFAQYFPHPQDREEFLLYLLLVRALRLSDQHSFEES
jgi:CRISPR-associated endonuclease/helicase Cas3